MKFLAKVLAAASLTFLVACGGGAGAGSEPEPSYVVSTLAGTAGEPGSTDGTGAAARFKDPNGIAVDSFGNIFVADASNSTIRKISASGAVTTFAGTAGQQGSADGTGASAQFDLPTGLAIDRNGNLYVTDRTNHTIRKITATGVVSTLAGSAGQSGATDGTGAAARFNYPYGLAVDSEGTVYVADTGNAIIRKITPSGIVTTIAGKAGIYSVNDGTGTAASFYTPTAIAIGNDGYIYIAEWESKIIRKITPTGDVTTIAGAALQLGSVDGATSAARFGNPNSIAVDENKNLFIVDTGNNSIRKISAAGIVSTIAGTTGQSGSVDGSGLAAKFNSPGSIALDINGNLYVSDIWNHTIRKLTVNR